MYSFSPTSGERFYNLIDQKDWLEKMLVTVTEKQVPSVTTSLGVWPKGEEFYKWMASKGSLQEANEERDAGGRRGTRVHQYIERIIKGEVISFHEYKQEHWKGNEMSAYAEWRRLENFVKWHSEMGYPTIVARRNGKAALECTLYSWEDQYAGTTDIIVTGGMFGDMKVMVDFKTGKDIYLSFWAQLAAYFKAWHEMKECKLDAVGVLLFGGQSRKGYRFEMITDVKEIEAWYLDFLAAYRIWKRDNQKTSLSQGVRTWTEIKMERDVYEVEEHLRLEQTALDRGLVVDEEEAPAWAQRPKSVIAPVIKPSKYHDSSLGEPLSSGKKFPRSKILIP